MKKMYIFCIIVMALCIVGTSILLMFMPDTIPTHYNIIGEIDRFGSKFESLIFPALTVIIGAFLLPLAKWQYKKSERANEKVLLYTCAAILVCCTAMGFYFMAKAISYDHNAAVQADVDAIHFISAAVGIMICVLGFIMPKARRNAIFGLRTGWSMVNDRVWEKSQRFGGAVAVIAGLAMVIAAVFVPGEWNILSVLAIIVIWVAVSTVASYHLYREDREEKQ